MSVQVVSRIALMPICKLKYKYLIEWEVGAMSGLVPIFKQKMCSMMPARRAFSA